MAAPPYATPLQRTWHYTLRVICGFIFFFLIAPIIAMGVWPDPFIDRIAQSVADLPQVEQIGGLFTLSSLTGG